jgi:sulfur-oxidizing protein SoxY
MHIQTRLARILLLTSLFCGLLTVASGSWAVASPSDNPEDSAVWKKLRTSLFQTRPISLAADDIIALEAPARAEDAAVVPVAIRARMLQTPARYISKVYLLIDNNPSPIAAIFEFTPLSGRADIETRVRVDDYTFMRAIAETNDGQLFMTTRFIKSSGGCSAPPGKDPQAALSTLGRMKFKFDELAGAAGPDQPVAVQLLINHPNASGLAMDQVTHLNMPAHYVRTVEVRLDGQPLMSADIDIAISENPSFHFYFLPTGKGELKAELTDSRAMQFEASAHYQRPQ